MYGPGRFMLKSRTFSPSRALDTVPRRIGRPTACLAHETCPPAGSHVNDFFLSFPPARKMLVSVLAYGVANALCPDETACLWKP